MRAEEKCVKPAKLQRRVGVGREHILRGVDDAWFSTNLNTAMDIQSEPQLGLHYTHNEVG